MVMPQTLAAQTAYPTKPVTVISPFAPGGLNDMCARAVAKGLQRESPPSR